MISFNSVSKEYPGGIVALDNATFKIDEGEFVFFVGPSGAGKSTIVRLLIREELPTAGEISFQDWDVVNLDPGKIPELRRDIGVVFQDFKLLPNLNLFENVAFALEASGKSETDIKEAVPYVLDLVSLAQRSTAFPDELSGGEKQRVGIARALVNNPKVLIADEPTGNLDPASAWDVVQLLNKINSWGTTVIMCTHGSDIVDSLEQRVVAMDKGRITRDDKHGRYETTADETEKQPETVATKVTLTSSFEEPKKPEKKAKKKAKRKPKEEKPEETFKDKHEEVKDTVDEKSKAKIEKLDISKKLKKKLIDLGVREIEQLDGIDAEDLAMMEVISKREAKEIFKGIEKWKER